MVKHGKLTFEYSRITTLIYVGTNMCCQTHFDKKLLKKGIKADISLEEKKLDQPFGVKQYLWLPTKDHAPPTMQQLRLGVLFLQELGKAKIKVYVHCQRGHTRAPTLVAAFLVSKGMSVKDAIALIKKRRKAVHINLKQRKQLERFARITKNLFK
jgi:protein-tyrosine phosphatase